MSRRHVVLVGLPGAGKSLVGRLAAERLEGLFLDLDREIVAATGMPVERIFAELGEPAFRAHERDAMERALLGAPAVLAPGGGWAAQNGALVQARRRGAFLIYLAVPPEVAAARVAAAEVVRPLLVGGGIGEMEDRMRNLLRARGGFYRQADLEIPADDAPAEVAERVADAARGSAGWARR